MKEKSRQKRLRLLAEAKKKPAVFTVYVVLRLIVVAILVSSILRGEYENAAICLLVLFLFLLPLFVQRNFGIELPGTLEIIILVFIFASEILGELGCFFINVPNWEFDPAYDDGLPLRGLRLCADRYPQPQRQDQIPAVADLRGARRVLLFDDDRRAVGIL